MLRAISGRVRSSPGLLAFAIYLGAIALLLGRHMLLHPRHACLCNGDSDPAITMWSLRWWPWAIAHGANPFVSHVVFPALNTAAATTTPTVGVLLAPVTLTLGPVFAYNVVALVGPALAGYAAVRLTRRLTGATGPAFIAGWLYLFASTVVSHLTSLPHVFLALLFPVIAELVVARASGALRRGPFIAGLAIALLLQLGISTELLFDVVVTGALVVVAVLIVEREVRRPLRGLVREIAIAGGIAAVMASPFLYYALSGPFPPIKNNLPNSGALDALNPFIPTSTTRLGRHYFGQVSARFQLASVTEAGGYMGIVLLAAYAVFTISSWRRFVTRVLFYVFAASALVALGAHLTIAGVRTIPMPWDLVSGLPIFRSAAPSRAIVLAELALAVAMACWLADRGGRRMWARWATVLAGVAMLVPNWSLPNWRGHERVPPLFAGGGYRHYIPKGAVVLALPFSFQDNATLWQAKTSMYFKLADAYLAPAPYRNPKDPALDAAIGQLIAPAKLDRAHFEYYLRARRIDAIVLRTGVPSGYNDPPGIVQTWWFALRRMGLHPRLAGGVAVYRPPARGLSADRRRRLPVPAG